ncbi:MAG: hypothetical protein V1837_02550 [Candidatus Woesearchaeota archaeon]
MASILSSRVKDDGKVVFEVIVDYDEAIQLQGHLDNIHLFSENVINVTANLSQRGKNEATKYFLVPRELRKNLKMSSEVTCQRIETKSRIFFVYVMDKLRP